MNAAKGIPTSNYLHETPDKLRLRNLAVYELCFPLKIEAAFRGMHVSPAKHSYWSVTDGRTDGQTDRQTDRRRTK